MDNKWNENQQKQNTKFTKKIYTPKNSRKKNIPKKCKICKQNWALLHLSAFFSYKKARGWGAITPLFLFERATLLYKPLFCLSVACVYIFSKILIGRKRDVLVGLLKMTAWCRSCIVYFWQFCFTWSIYVNEVIF